MSGHDYLIDGDLLNTASVQLLPAEEFRRAFLAALAGEENEFSPFVRVVPGRPNAREWAVIRQRIFERDDFTCRYCGQRGGTLECDHVHPVAKGGRHEDSNLVTACRPCNRAKRDHTLEALGWTLK